MKIAVYLVAVLVLLSTATGYADIGPSKVDPFGPAKGPLNVSISAADTPVAEVLTSLAGQSRQKILVESSVLGKVKLELKDVPLDDALNAVCKSTKMTWRKIYIDPKSELIQKPDRFASTLRLMAGMSFPDVVVAGSSTSKIGVHCEHKRGVEDAQDKIVKDLGMEPVYLVSNDAAVAAKEAVKNTPVAKYTNMAKEQIDMFLKMTPEEKEQAMLSSLDMMNNVGPEYMASVMQSLRNTNPDTLKRLMSRQMDALFTMPVEQRRAMTRMNMEAVKLITPEQMKILQEDAMAIAEEMKNAQPTP